MRTRFLQGSDKQVREIDSYREFFAQATEAWIEWDMLIAWWSIDESCDPIRKAHDAYIWDNKGHIFFCVDNDYCTL